MEKIAIRGWFYKFNIIDLMPCYIKHAGCPCLNDSLYSHGILHNKV